MNRVLGLALLIIGATLLYYGWQSHDATVLDVSGAVERASGSKVIWMLGLGAVTAVWGLYLILLRTVP